MKIPREDYSCQMTKYRSKDRVLKDERESLTRITSNI